MALKWRNTVNRITNYIYLLPMKSVFGRKERAPVKGEALL
jgi:hypothetical protein